VRIGQAAGRAAAVLAVFALALAIRAVSLPAVFHAGQAQLVPLDDLYHAKRVLFSVTHFPRVLDWDPDRGLKGSYCPWPPLYDLFLAGQARLLHAHGTREILRSAIWFPPLFTSAFAALAAWFLARRVNLATGLVAGLGLALSPSLVSVSRLGTIDHHFLEPAFAVGIAMAVLFALEGGPPSGSLGRRSLLLGLAISLALLVQTAMLFPAALALAATLLVGRSRTAFAAVGLGFTLAAAVVLAYRVGRPTGYPDEAWYLGTSHFAALAGAAVICGIVVWKPLSGPMRFGSGWDAALGVAVGGLAAASIPGALTGILQGVGFFGGDPWLREIQEFRPLFHVRGSAMSILDDLLNLGGGALLAIPFALRSFLRGTAARRVLSVFAIGLLCGAISSYRLTVTASGILAILAALVVSDQIRLRRFIRAAAVGALALGPGVAGCIRFLPEFRSIVPVSARPMLAAADYLRTHKDAAGRVLGPWWAGHALDVLGAHPVVVDNFGAAEGRPLFDEAVGLLLSPREETVARYCRDHGVRFLVIENPADAVESTARMLEVPVSLYVEAVTSSGGKLVWYPTRLLKASFWWRAYRGSEPASGSSMPLPPFRFFRLRYPDPARFGDRLPVTSQALQIWEFVPAGS